MDKQFIENCKKEGQDNCEQRADLEKNNVSFRDYQRSKETRERLRKQEQQRIMREASEYKYKYLQHD